MLERGRRLAKSWVGQRHQVDDVLGADARSHVGARREFRIEPHVETVKVVEELVVAEQRRVGPNVVDVQQLPPAVMADNDVRRKPQRF